MIFIYALFAALWSSFLTLCWVVVKARNYQDEDYEREGEWALMRFNTIERLLDQVAPWRCFLPSHKFIMRLIGFSVCATALLGIYFLVL